MSKNDEKIKKLLVVLDTKKENLKAKPKMSLKSNGIIEYDSKIININTINSIDLCITITANLLSKYNNIKQAAELLNVTLKSDQFNSYMDYIHDLKLKASILLWQEKNKDIKQLENKLKSLRSEDLKTEDELKEISNLLKD